MAHPSFVGDKVPMTPTDIRFAADGMLQSLATWLRLMGCDQSAAIRQERYDTNSAKTTMSI
jgi:uncharacterized protein with PIN domain